MTTLYVQDGSVFREAAAPEVFSRTRSLIAQRFRTGSQVLSRPSVVQEFLHLRLGGLEYEVFGLLHLDNRYRLIEVEELFRGTLSEAAVHPREVIKSALAHNSAAVILFHNHPSGALEPSQPDEFITLRLRDALALVDIRVLDHLIVGDGTFSFAQHGLL
jgi:DNA repair protein RadC